MKYRITSSTGWQTQADIEANLPNYENEVLWWVVDPYGKHLENLGIRLDFPSEKEAAEFCEKMNGFIEAGIILLI